MVIKKGMVYPSKSCSSLWLFPSQQCRPCRASSQTRPPVAVLCGCFHYVCARCRSNHPSESLVVLQFFVVVSTRLRSASSSHPGRVYVVAVLCGCFFTARDFRGIAKRFRELVLQFFVVVSIETRNLTRCLFPERCGPVAVLCGCFALPRLSGL